MRTFGLLLSLAFPVLSFGQISLENTYSNIDGIRGFSADGNDYYFVRKTSTIEIYSTSHSLVQTISPTLSSGYEIQNGYFPSKKLFDTDSGFEVYIIAWNSSTVDYESYIVNQDGSILKDFGGNWFYPRVRNMGGNSKLILSGNSNTTEGRVYDLPGTWTGMKEPSTNPVEAGNPYPNPSNSKVNLSYELGEASKGTLRIHNSQGELIKEVQVGNAFDHYRFDVGQVSSGTYFYTVETKEGKSKGEKFVVE